MRHYYLIPITFWSIVILLLSSALSFASETEMDSPLPALTSSESGTDAVLVIDVSGSMKQSDPEYLYPDIVVENTDDLQTYAEENLSMKGSPLKKEEKNSK